MSNVKSMPQITRLVGRSVEKRIAKKGFKASEILSELNRTAISIALNTFYEEYPNANLDSMLADANDSENTLTKQLVYNSCGDLPLQPEDERGAIRKALCSLDTRWMTVLFPEVERTIKYEDKPVLAVLRSKMTDHLSDQQIIVKMVDHWREEYIGILINSILDTAPAFVYTYGSKSCGDTLTEKAGAPCFPRNDGKNPANERQLMTEYVKDSRTLYKWLGDKRSEESILSVFLQVFANLLEANNRCGFVHNDLHAQNVLVCDAPDGVCIPLEGDLYDLAQVDCARIIDFGFASIVNPQGEVFACATQLVPNYDKVWTDLIRLMVTCSGVGPNQDVLNKIWRTHMGVVQDLDNFEFFQKYYATFPATKYAYRSLVEPSKIVESLARALVGLISPHSKQSPKKKFAYSRAALVALKDGKYSMRDKLVLKKTAQGILDRINALYARDSMEDAVRQYHFLKTSSKDALERMRFKKAVVQAFEDARAIAALMDTLDFVLYKSEESNKAQILDALKKTYFDTFQNPMLADTVMRDSFAKYKPQ